MRRNLLVRTVTVAVSVAALIAPMVSVYAATPIKLSFPSQLPQVVAGKSYTYALSTRVSGGTGKPYTFKLTGALPTGLKMSTNGELYGAIPKTAKNGTYVVKICATGAKKTGSTASWNTACKTSSLVLTGGIGNSTVPNTPNSGGNSTYSLKVSKAGDGQGTVSANSGALSCGSNCEESYSAGTQVSLIASPSSGAIFSGWSGACTGTGSCTVSLNSNVLVTANFSANSSGTYAGNVTTPVMAICSPSTFERTVTLVETAGGAITGKTNHGFPTTLSGTRAGNSITVTLQMQFGPRGPFIWQWNGSTLTGTLPAFCVDSSTSAMLGEGSYQFVLTKR
jgi:hypothetical protein